MSQRLEGSKLTAQLEGLCGETYAVRIWTALPIEGVKGGKLLETEPKSVEVSFDAAGRPGFVRKVLEVRFKQE